VAAKAVIDPKFTMQRQRGQWLAGPRGAPAMATYHPAYLFRLDGEARAEATAALESDLRAARKRLEEGGASEGRAETDGPH
jgi:uracil-DNA glycosylase